MGAPMWRRYLRFLGPDPEADLDEELRFHLETRTEELVAAGMEPHAARATALREFGDVARVREECRRIDRGAARGRRRREHLDGIRQDLLYGARQLRRSPGFAAGVVLTLALGIGANTAVFSVVGGVLLRPLPYPDPERLVAVTPEHTYSPAEYAGLRDRTRTFAALAAYTGGEGASLGGGGEPLRVRTSRVSANLFATLGVRARVGRTLLPGEDAPGRDGVALLSEGLWRERFGGDPGVVGRTIRLDGRERTVVGVMPADFRFPAAGVRLWTPMRIDPADPGESWGGAPYNVVGRLAPGRSADVARGDVLRILRALRLENPLWTPEETAYLASIEIVPLRDHLVGATRPMLLVLLGAVGLVLLVACANVANVLLARGVAREREMAVRASLGAGRLRLARQLLVESLLLSLLGGGAGLLLALAGVRLLRSLLPADTPRLAEIAVDARVLAFALAVTLLTGIVFGLLPAWRGSGVSLEGTLREGGRSSSTGRRQRRGAAALVMVEMALSVVLVIGAGLLVRSLWRLQRVDPGFRTERLVTARIAPPEAQFREPEHRRAFYAEVLARAGSLGGVREVALTSQLPFDGETEMRAVFVKGVTTDPDVLPMFDQRRATPGYFRAMGVPLLRGRAFTAADRPGALQVALVDETAARRFWPGQDPIGKVIGFPWEQRWLTVVGVVGAVRNNDLAAERKPTLYVPFAQEPSAAATLVVRTAAEPGALESQLRALVAGVDADVPVSDVRTMRERVLGSLVGPRLVTTLLSGFAAVALLLAAVGIYGVLGYAVRQRTRELGVRMALGATPARLRWAVLRQGVGLALAGLLLGTGASLLATHALASLLYGVGTLDPVVYASVPLLLVPVAVLASYLPARRATRVDPLTALRSD